MLLHQALMWLTDALVSLGKRHAKRKLVEERVTLTCYLALKAGLGFVQTIVRIHWIPVYKAVHRIHLQFRGICVR